MFLMGMHHLPDVRDCLSMGKPQRGRAMAANVRRSRLEENVRYLHVAGNSDAYAHAELLCKVRLMIVALRVVQ